MSLTEVIVPGVTTGHDTDHLELHDWFNSFSTIVIGADGTEADIANALADQHAAGGGTVITMGDLYDVVGLSDPAFEITLPTVSLKSAARTVFHYSGTGTCVRIHTDPFDVDQAGTMEGIWVVSNGAGANAVGIHMGDVVGFTLRDVVVYGFTGAAGVGLWLDNAVAWTERNQTEKVWLGNNKVGLLFTVQSGANISFGYNQFTGIEFNVHAGQFGIVSRDGALIYGGTFGCILNVESGGQVALIEDGSFWWRERVQIQGELMGGTGVGIAVTTGAAFWVSGVIGLPSLPCSNTNAASITPKYRVMGSGEAISDGNANDLGSGVKANLFGTGVAARVIPTQVSNNNSPYGFSGFLEGANVSCPFVCMYDHPSNCFVIYKLAFGNAPELMTEVFRFSTTGAIAILNDTTLYREAAGVLRTGGTFKTASDVTANRPAAATVGFGAQWFDATLQKPIWSNGTSWLDASGATV